MDKKNGVLNVYFISSLDLQNFENVDIDSSPKGQLTFLSLVFILNIGYGKPPLLEF